MQCKHTVCGVLIDSTTHTHTHTHTHTNTHTNSISVQVESRMKQLEQELSEAKAEKEKLERRFLEGTTYTVLLSMCRSMGSEVSGSYSRLNCKPYLVTQW